MPFLEDSGKKSDVITGAFIEQWDTDDFQDNTLRTAHILESGANLLDFLLRPPGEHGTAKVAKAARETHEIVDLADVIHELPEATPGHALCLTTTVELNREGEVSEDAIANVNEVLAKVKAGWTL